MPSTRRRPDPDALLARLKSDEARPGGHLKIFLGYCAGVGKTYAMLEAARAQRDQGRRVLIGVVETHGRVETEALLEGLEALPRASLEHRGVQLQEFDLDACLAARPELVLVDELAHSNVPGSRHAKRYSDIEELLDAGIDVYSAMNIQHLESLNDVVLQITGVRVRETVPDRILYRSHSIELVDLPSQELLRRLQDGKVYLGPKAGAAADNFFRPGNLVALRELALRSAANHIDREVVGYMRKRSIAGPWPVRERLLVAVGPSPLSERLIRSAKRLAENLDAEWLAVSVEGSETYTPDARERAAAHLRLAASLGARTEQITGTSIPVRLVEYARTHNVTQIVTGKPLRGGLWGRLVPDLVDDLIRHSGDIDVYVISSDGTTRPPLRRTPWSPAGSYLAATGGVLAVSLLAAAIPGVRELAPINLVMIYLALVCSIAYYLGRGPAALASTLSVALFDFCFVPPFYTFAVSDGEYLITFGAFLLVSLMISSLTAKAREQAVAAGRREDQTVALLALSRDFSASRSSREVGTVLESHVRRRLDPQARVYLERPSDLAPSERGVAEWAWQNARPAGRGSDTLPQASLTCLPVSAQEKVVALLVMRRTASLLPPEQQLLDSFLLQAALAWERLGLMDVAQKAEVMQATDRLQTALLNSVSHDLRIPLVSIMGALQAVRDQGQEPLEESARQSLVENALCEADRLNRIVGNLLQMSQLESGALRIQGQPQDVADLLGHTITLVRGLDVWLDLADDLPLVFCDYLLTQQILLNLLDNARKYAGIEQPVEIRARPHESGAFVQICVADCGPGIPAGEREQVFERFYRSPNAPPESGTGLGLSICRGLVEAQGGTIVVTDSTRGTRICFTLPCDV